MGSILKIKRIIQLTGIGIYYLYTIKPLTVYCVKIGFSDKILISVLVYLLSHNHLSLFTISF